MARRYPKNERETGLTVSKTGYYTHRDCWKHEMGPGHPECPARLDAIEDRLLVTGIADALDHREVPLAPLADIELAHDRMYIASLRGLSDRLIEEEDAGGPAHMQLDTDTSINRHTWTAALRSAGAALAATDAVMAGEIERYNLQRVAVVDFDVHHGNGTEDILAGDPRALMVSIFQHPFYPYSGDQNPAPNMLNVPVPAYTKGMDVRDIVEMVWMPRLEQFKPEMIFVSAGFDAHREDDMGQLGLTEQDYTWITMRIKDVARRFSNKRIVSCLEGGYMMGPLARSVEAHIRVLADL
jgi:acetoin utilization deacetylase AcuC-like enzyme